MPTRTRTGWWRNRLAVWASIGVILLVFGSPLLVECGRQYDIHRAEAKYQRALEHAGSEWQGQKDWGSWYHDAAGDTPGAAEFSRLCADAREFEQRANMMPETLEAFDWLRGEHGRLPSPHQHQRIYWYLQASRTFLAQTVGLLVHSQLLEPPAADIGGSFSRGASALHLTHLLELRVTLLLWTGDFKAAADDLQVLLQLPARLQPRLLAADHSLALLCAESSLSLCAQWMRLAPSGQLGLIPPELLQAPVLDEASLLDSWTRHAAHVVAGREANDAEWTRAFDLFGSYAWFGWVNPPMEWQSRLDVFLQAGQATRRGADDWRRLRENRDALRAALPVTAAESCVPLWFARLTMTTCVLRAQQGRALQQLRTVGGLGTHAIEAPDFEVVDDPNGPKLVMRPGVRSRPEYQPFAEYIENHFPAVVLTDR